MAQLRLGYGTMERGYLKHFFYNNAHAFDVFICTYVMLFSTVTVTKSLFSSSRLFAILKKKSHRHLLK